MADCVGDKDTLQTLFVVLLLCNHTHTHTHTHTHAHTQHTHTHTHTHTHSDGLGRTGTFCTLYYVLDRVKTEQVVDVFQAVKTLRIQRTGLLENMVGYVGTVWGTGGGGGGTVWALGGWHGGMQSVCSSPQQPTTCS